jgi:hypothetical protein
MGADVAERREKLNAWVENNPFRKWRKEQGYQSVAFGHIGTPNSMKNWERGQVRPSPLKMSQLAGEMKISQLKLEEQWTDWEKARPH